MLGKGELCSKYTLHDLLSEKQLSHVMRETLGDKDWTLKTYDLKPASEGLAGFLGDHFKITLHARHLQECTREVKLFLKHLPIENKFKAQFISENGFFKREMIMSRLFEEMPKISGAPDWHAKVYVYNESLIVMPDLSHEGYKLWPRSEVFDLQHLQLATEAVARFHASFTNYETRRSMIEKRVYSIVEDHSDILADFTYSDSPWLRTAAKVVKDYIGVFSSKFSGEIPGLEEKFIETTETFPENEDVLNVVIHKDLWVDNIMFKYVNDAPASALLIDFQSVRYGPPAFDLMILLYLNTSREFRDRYEKEILNHYYSVFMDSLEEGSRERIEKLQYNNEEFLLWCEKARRFGIMCAGCLFPYTLMDAKSAEEVFNCAESFERMTNEDRSAPVVAYARRSPGYRRRLLELFEEFVERYVTGTS